MSLLDPRPRGQQAGLPEKSAKAGGLHRGDDAVAVFGPSELPEGRSVHDGCAAVAAPRPFRL